MYNNNKYDTELDIRLNNGIYIFDCKSSTGKTRLCKLIKNMRACGEQVAACTYHDILNGVNIKELINDNKNKVIMLDRYDMYNGCYSEQILEASKRAIVLIDCKGIPDICDSWDTCEINMTEHKIEVSE